MNNPWSIEDDIRLFRWITDFKPAGVHKHFHMISILGRMNKPDQFPVVLLFDKLKSDGKSQFVADEVWAKLDQHYDLAKVDERENMVLDQDQQHRDFDENELNEEDEEKGRGQEAHFNDRSHFQALRRVFKAPREFSLPWDEYGELILGNAKNEVEDYQEDEGKGSGPEDAGQDLSSGKSHTDIGQKERSPKRVTRSTATHTQSGRVTRSKGPAPVSKSDEEDQEDGDGDAKSDEGTESGSGPDRGEISSPQEESRMSSIDREDQDPKSHETDIEQKEIVEAIPAQETSSAPSTVEAEHAAPLPEGSPPSKRTRTTRSHPTEAVSETNDLDKEPASLAPVQTPSEAEPQTQQVVRMSSRVANRRKSRR
ncbi:Eaf7p LALA0_S04e01706g [Lachancea lanzarotensis]|uniref:Chromatin modification-related protein EAF7 n=1 Tax=Lachancea lanzarotensis TaxID=1245769 RepID=A0A0C7N1I5_9SACH|nr:uncharacterized protein LALA0_S04e01706g [Lachancea lanzarotensis]CEP61831.1 LALA0S04e01706g1_1 [Lachancea lanzarotensis]